MNPRVSSLTFLLALLLPACRSNGDPAQAAGTNPVPVRLLEGMGDTHFPITTREPMAQRFFDQGLAWCYGFHHDEAVRSFQEAARLDPGCAMAYWGMAYATGPHINNMEMTEEATRLAHDNAQKALSLAATVTPLERALIEAVAKRYVWPAPQDRKSLDLAYAEAMRPVHEAYGTNPDVAALFAESLMDLRPWQLWGKDGKPAPETPEIVRVLEAGLARHPKHPQLCHLYIHAVEASPHPEKALTAAETLDGLVPGVGHLVHMPSHIYVRTAHYERVTETNRRAVEVDRSIVARTGRVGFYELYRAHNFHFVVYGAMFEGRSGDAIRYAREMVTELPADVVRAMPQFLEGFMAVPYHALVRFGRFEEMLREPEPAAYLPATRAFWHYGRGVSLAALGRVDAAVAEQQAFEKAFAAVPENYTMGNNPLRTILEIGRSILKGEIEFRRGNHDVAFAALRDAVRRDEELKYDEPWGWMMPASHPLGALLLAAGRVSEAEEVYRADLKRHPENGWALVGLEECLRKSGKTAEAEAIGARLAKAFARADLEIHSSCFCKTGE